MTSIDYTSRDFAAIKESLLERANELIPEWRTDNASDFGLTLVELFAYAADVLAFYQDRISGEAYIGTATQEATVRDIAQLLGYSPVGLAPAVGTVTFTAPTSITEVVVIPAGTQVQTVQPNGLPGLVFETDEDVTIEGPTLSPPVYSKSVTVTQGRTVALEVLGVSDGRASQSHAFFHPNVVESSVELEVVEATGRTFQWTRVYDLYESGPTDLHYVLRTDGNGITRAVLGDGFYGALPAKDAQIVARYRHADGAAGNVGANSITQIVGYVSNVSGVTNDAPTLGGEDRESVESIRTNAPAARVASSRAVTTEDYANLALRVPGVSKAEATASSWNAIVLYVAPEAGSVLTDSQKEAVLNFLDPRKMIGASVQLADPTYVPVVVTLHVQVLDGFRQAAIEQLVRDAIRDLFAFDNTSFGQNVSLSLLYHTLQGTTGVDYAVVSEMYDSREAVNVGNVDLGYGEIPTLGTLTMTIDGGMPDGDLGGG